MHRDSNKLLKIMLGLFAAIYFTVTTVYAQEAVLKEVTQINRQLFDALIDGDADKITSLYTIDGTLFPPTGEIIKGKSDIREYWSGSIHSSKTLKVETKNIDFEFYANDTAYESGSYQLDYKLPDDSEVQRVEGIYLIIWKKIGDSWKLHVDMWN